MPVQDLPQPSAGSGFPSTLSTQPYTLDPLPSTLNPDLGAPAESRGGGCAHVSEIHAFRVLAGSYIAVNDTPGPGKPSTLYPKP